MWLKEKQLILEVNSDERPNDERLTRYFTNAVTSTELHTPVQQNQQHFHITCLTCHEWKQTVLQGIVFFTNSCHI